MDSGFYFVSGTWTPNSGFLELYSGFQSPGFWIPESRIPSREAKLNVVAQTRLLQRFFSVYYEPNSLGGLGNGDVDDNDNDNVKKTIVFMRKATALHVHHAFFRKTESLDNAVLEL